MFAAKENRATLNVGRRKNTQNDRSFEQREQKKTAKRTHLTQVYNYKPQTGKWSSYLRHLCSFPRLSQHHVARNRA